MDDQIEDAELEFDHEDDEEKSGKKAEQREKRASKKRQMPEREESMQEFETEHSMKDTQGELRKDKRGEEAIELMERDEDERDDEARQTGTMN